MERENLPEDVVRFVEQHLDTVPHLEALLLMWESAPRPWTEAEIAARVYVSPDTARRILQDLARAGLLKSGNADPSGYLYAPSTEINAELVPRLAAVYTRHLVRIASLIHSKTSPAVREFARAFQIKSER